MTPLYDNDINYEIVGLNDFSDYLIMILSYLIDMAVAPVQNRELIYSIISCRASCVTFLKNGKDKRGGPYFTMKFCSFSFNAHWQYSSKLSIFRNG